MKNSDLRFSLLFVLLALFSVRAAADDIEWNGFGSMYYSQAFTADFLPANLDDQYPNFSDFSVFGLNVSSQFSDELSAAAQLVASNTQGSSASWVLTAKWAYVLYKPLANLQIKGGRQLLPILFANEFSNVGYLLPYRVIPSTIASAIPFVGFDGLSTSYVLGDGFLGSFKIGAFTGIANVVNTGSSTGFERNVLGVTLDTQSEGLGLHAMLMHSEVDRTLLVSPFLHLTSNSQTAALGFRYDKHNLVSWSEGLYRWSEDGFLHSVKAAYALVGYRFGKWMPRYTYSVDDWNSTGRDAFLQIHGIGVNYQLASQAVMKIDYEYLLGDASRDPAPALRGAGSTNSTIGRAIYAGIDFIF